MKKMMFNDRYGLTQAVLDGRKRVTRRIIPEKLLSDALDYVERNARMDWNEEKEDAEADAYVIRHATYKVGDVVKVAQCLRDMGYNPHEKNWSRGEIWGLDHTPAWTNKMFVRAEDCIHEILITNVRLERLQAISDEDCLQEGVWKDEAGGRVIGYPFGVPFFYTYDGAVNKKTGKQLHWTTPREAFAALIDRVSGKGTWESNPYVFVYEFTILI
jgi:hypothetical protein